MDHEWLNAGMDENDPLWNSMDAADDSGIERESLVGPDSDDLHHDFWAVVCWQTTGAADLSITQNWIAGVLATDARLNDGRALTLMLKRLWRSTVLPREALDK